jgi:putative phosphoesterase
VKIGLISDTHGRLRNNVLDVFAGVDVILHAGDIGSLDIITTLEAIAPVHAVHGNTDDFDICAKYGESVMVELAGVKFAIAHGHLFGSPNPKSLRAAFPEVDVIIYGHTHVPLVDRTAKPIVINPGAAGPARFQLKPSVAILQLPQLELTQALL